MQDQQPLDHQIIDSNQPTRRFPIGVIAALSAVVLAAGAGTAWWSWNALSGQSDNPPVSTEEPANPDTTANEPTQPDPAPIAVESTVQVYLLDVAGDRFELVPSPVQLDASTEPSETLTTAFEELLAGTVESEAFSEIPADTELLDLTVDSDGVHVNLSSDFEVGGGSASMTGRLAQVIYTASSLEPTAPIWLSIEGAPLEFLGGEGLIIDQPMTRSQFEENFSL